jgi:digalactosyldiacylglycerol synthase
MAPRYRTPASLRWFYAAFALLLIIATAHADEIPESAEKCDHEQVKVPKTVISLGESIEISRRSLVDPEVEEIRRQYWKRTFSEIRELATGIPRNSQAKMGGGKFLSQWKLLLDDPISYEATHAQNGTADDDFSAANLTTAQMYNQPLRRFEGFASWERLIQDWTEDVQHYLDETQAENKGEYPMSSFGRTALRAQETIPSQDSNSWVDTRQESTRQDSTRQESDMVELEEQSAHTAKKNSSLPIPAPAKPGEAVLPHTDISDKSKRLLIVTTAAMPWRTGTAVNPLLRAAYLTKGREKSGGGVTLMLPWLERKSDQERVYGAANTFETPEDQESYIRTWLRDDAGFVQASEDLKIQWYTAWQNKVENSIYSMGDITALVSADDFDICILEEPEHLNWYRAPGESWTKKFKHVVGILHTNYFQYALDQPAALIRAPAMRLLCSWMCRAHCHRVIKLSGTLDKVAPEKELVENVHGVRGTFLDVGEKLRRKLQSPLPVEDPVFSAEAEPTIYFIGKMLWSKGLGSLMELLKYAEESADLKVKVDMYGGGPDMNAADSKSSKLSLDMIFHGPLDHAELASTHKIFVNPSASEVLCTTSAEALAMGKFVIIPSHPSNDFFAQFPNCLTYATKEEFVGYLYYAMTHSPEPLTEEYARELSWDAATERLEAAGCIPVEESEKMKEAMASDDAGIEISLPPLVESIEGRKALATTLRVSRDRYRLFRNRLSNEIENSSVLPKPLREKMLSELNKRLDLNLDEILESPKLRLKLSPAELDKACLEVHDKISQSPSGDVLRVLCGAGSIGLQNLYMRRQAIKQKRRDRTGESVPYFLDDVDMEEESERMPVQRIRWAMRRNLPKKNGKSSTLPARKKATAVEQTTQTRDTPSMSALGRKPPPLTVPSSWVGMRSASSLKLRPPVCRSKSVSLLI